jgi:hypothetical protein
VCGEKKGKKRGRRWHRKEEDVALREKEKTEEQERKRRYEKCNKENKKEGGITEEKEKTSS